MKTLTKGISLILALSLLCAIPVAAEDAVAPCASDYIAVTSTYLYEIDGNRFGVWFEIMATGTMDELGVSSVVMQKSSDGVTWRNIKTFYPENYSQMIVENDSFYGAGLPYTGTYNYYYRAYVEFYAKKGNGSGYYYMYTDVLHLQVK